MSENKYTTLWEIEKPYEDKVVKKSAIIISIVNFAILLTGAGISVLILQYLHPIEFSDSLLFGYGIGIFMMFITVIVTLKYTKIRTD